MADRMICISWGATVHGREERALEVFNEAVGLYGRMQQDGRIDSFDVALLAPNGPGMDGFMCLRGSAQQMAAVREDEEFMRNTTDAALVVNNLRHLDGTTNEEVAGQVARYQDAIGRVPQAV